MSSDKFNFPSGVQLPFILQQRLQAASNDTDGGGAAASGVSQAEEDDVFLTNAVQPSDDDTASSLSQELLDRTFSAEELEARLWNSSTCLVELQKQIHRGEEAYYEETFGHGSLFKGWEGYLDAKAAAATTSNFSGTRRVPVDYRWFSGSSRISKTAMVPIASSTTTAKANPTGEAIPRLPTSAVATVVASKSQQAAAARPQASAVMPTGPLETTTTTTTSTTIPVPPAAQLPPEEPAAAPPPVKKGRGRPRKRKSIVDA